MRAIEYAVTPLGYALSRLLRPLWPGVVLSRLAGFRLVDREDPPLPGGDWVRVRTRLAGLCGTDLAILAQKQPVDSILQAYSSLPLLLGHENVAEVCEVGPEVDPAWMGRRVTVEPTLGCTARGIDPPCSRCRLGQFGACENFGAAGAGRYGLPAGTSIGYNNRTGGSYGERFCAHLSQLVEVPEGLDDELAVLTDPVACSLHSVLRARLDGVRHVLVYGAGVLGLAAVAALRAIGFDGRLDAVGRSAYIKPLARRLGADAYLRLSDDPRERFETVAARTGAAVRTARFGQRMLDGGYDVIFDCAGTTQSVNESLKWTRARGQVVMVGTGSGGRVDLTPIWFRELSVIGSYGRQFERYGGREIGTYQLVHRLMLGGRLNLRALLTHVLPFSKARRAFGIALHKSRHEALKVALDFRGE
jgi:threonine dehydrogenase-like Zn-dependent dehydrogenase